jgi:hypothetical protein
MAERFYREIYRRADLVGFSVQDPVALPNVVDREDVRACAKCGFPSHSLNRVNGVAGQDDTDPVRSV